MRFDPMFDSLSILGSLWAALSGSQVCTSSLPEPSRPAEVTAFIDVNVIPMDTERVLANHTVLVEGGRITALAPANKIQVPVGAVRIDGRGKYLIPGLTDMHAHSYFSSDAYDKLAPRLFTFLANGVTAIRYFNPFSGDPQAFERAGVVSPHIYIAGFDISESTVRRQGLSTTTAPRPDSAAAYLAAAKVAGYDFIRIDVPALYTRNTRPIVDSLLVAARRLKVAVVAHDHEDSFARTLALGTVGGSAEHLGWFRDTLGFRRAEYSDTLGQRETEMLVAKIPALAAAAGRAGLWITPTLDCTETKYTVSPANLLILRHMVKALQGAGVGLLLGGDASLAREWPSVVHSELAALVRAGLTPYQALLTGTRNPAEFLGKLEETGTVAVGKRADLILLSSNPLADIRHTREPAGVMINGQWLDRVALDQGLLTLPKSKSKSWLRLGVMHGGIYPYPSMPMGESKPTAVSQKLEVHVKTFETLTDSLSMAKPSESDRVRRRLATELEAMRALLTPEQHKTFDVIARVWLREQARQGHRVAIVGLTQEP